MIGQHTIQQINVLKCLGQSQREISKELNIDRRTVNKYLQNPFLRKRVTNKLSKLDPFKDIIKQLLENDLSVTAVKIFNKIKNSGFTGSYSTVRNYFRKLKGHLAENENNKIDINELNILKAKSELFN